MDESGKKCLDIVEISPGCSASSAGPCRVPSRAWRWATPSFSFTMPLSLKYIFIGTIVMPSRPTAAHSRDNSLRDTNSLRRRRSSCPKVLACR
jgi:hypothetical protein